MKRQRPCTQDGECFIIKGMLCEEQMYLFTSPWRTSTESASKRNKTLLPQKALEKLFYCALHIAMHLCL